MAERLYIRHPNDLPHAQGPLPGLTACGLDLGGTEEITDAQAEVFLDDRRCLTCWPHHIPRAQQRGGRRRGFGVRH